MVTKNKRQFGFELLQQSNQIYFENSILFFVIRNNEKYVPYSLVKRYIIPKIQRIFSSRLLRIIPVRKVVMTVEEAVHLNNIEPGVLTGELFMEGHSMLNLEDLIKMWMFFKAAQDIVRKKKRTNPLFGFVSISDNLVPFINCRGTKLVPLFYFNGENTYLEQRTFLVTDLRHLSYLRFCFIAQKIRKEFYEWKSITVVDLKDVKNVFPNESFNLAFPAEINSILLTSSAPRQHSSVQQEPKSASTSVCTTTNIEPIILNVKVISLDNTDLHSNKNEESTLRMPIKPQLQLNCDSAPSINRLNGLVPEVRMEVPNKDSILSNSKKECDSKINIRSETLRNPGNQSNKNQVLAKVLPEQCKIDKITEIHSSEKIFKKVKQPIHKSNSIKNMSVKTKTVQGTVNKIASLPNVVSDTELNNRNTILIPNGKSSSLSNTACLIQQQKNKLKKSKANDMPLLETVATINKIISSPAAETVPNSTIRTKASLDLENTNKSEQPMYAYDRFKLKSSATAAPLSYETPENISNDRNINLKLKEEAIEIEESTFSHMSLMKRNNIADQIIQLSTIQIKKGSSSSIKIVGDEFTSNDLPSMDTTIVANQTTPFSVSQMKEETPSSPNAAVVNQNMFDDPLSMETDNATSHITSKPVTQIKEFPSSPGRTAVNESAYNDVPLIETTKSTDQIFQLPVTQIKEETTVVGESMSDDLPSMETDNATNHIIPLPVIQIKEESPSSPETIAVNESASNDLSLIETTNNADQIIQLPVIQIKEEIPSSPKTTAADVPLIERTNAAKQLTPLSVTQIKESLSSPNTTAVNESASNNLLFTTGTINAADQLIPLSVAEMSSNNVKRANADLNLKLAINREQQISLTERPHYNSKVNASENIASLSHDVSAISSDDPKTIPKLKEALPSPNTTALSESKSKNMPLPVKINVSPPIDYSSFVIPLPTPKISLNNIISDVKGAEQFFQETRDTTNNQITAVKCTNDLDILQSTNDVNQTISSPVVPANTVKNANVEQTLRANYPTASFNQYNQSSKLRLPSASNNLLILRGAKSDNRTIKPSPVRIVPDNVVKTWKTAQQFLRIITPTAPLSYDIRTRNINRNNRNTFLKLPETYLTDTTPLYDFTSDDLEMLKIPTTNQTIQSTETFQAKQPIRKLTEVPPPTDVTASYESTLKDPEITEIANSAIQITESSAARKVPNSVIRKARHTARQRFSRVSYLQRVPFAASNNNSTDTNGSHQYISNDQAKSTNQNIPSLNFSNENSITRLTEVPISRNVTVSYESNSNNLKTLEEVNSANQYTPPLIVRLASSNINTENSEQIPKTDYSIDKFSYDTPDISSNNLKPIPGLIEAPASRGITVSCESKSNNLNLLENTNNENQNISPLNVRSVSSNLNIRNIEPFSGANNSNNQNPIVGLTEAPASRDTASCEFTFNNPVLEKPNSSYKSFSSLSEQFQRADYSTESFSYALPDISFNNPNPISGLTKTPTSIDVTAAYKSTFNSAEVLEIPISGNQSISSVSAGTVLSNINAENGKKTSYDVPVIGSLNNLNPVPELIVCPSRDGTPSYETTHNYSIQTIPRTIGNNRELPATTIATNNGIAQLSEHQRQPCAVPEAQAIAYQNAMENLYRPQTFSTSYVTNYTEQYGTTLASEQSGNVTPTVVEMGQQSFSRQHYFDPGYVATPRPLQTPRPVGTSYNHNYFETRETYTVFNKRYQHQNGNIHGPFYNQNTYRNIVPVNKPPIFHNRQQPVSNRLIFNPKPKKRIRSQINNKILIGKKPRYEQFLNANSHATSATYTTNGYIYKQHTGYFCNPAEFSNYEYQFNSFPNTTALPNLYNTI